MGGIILVASIIIWFLGYFPRTGSSNELFETQMNETRVHYAQVLQQTPESEQALILARQDSIIRKIEQKQHRQQQEESYIGRIGHAMEPLIRPLGFDWKMGVSLLSGVAAKEIVVSTMAVLYQSAHDEENDSSALVQNLRNDKDKDGNPVFTPLVALSRSEEHTSELQSRPHLVCR